MNNATSPSAASDFYCLHTQTRLTQAQLAQRACVQNHASLAQQAAHFVPDAALEASIHAAIALGKPLLINGEAGLGKTEVAYYVAQRLGLEPVLHFYAHAASQLSDLLYDFDAVGYWQAVQLAVQQAAAAPKKAAFVQPNVLWQALRSELPRVVLIDNIDAAPRTFAHDLSAVLDNLSFFIKELNKSFTAPPHKRPLMFITSNQEKPLPAAFLRRCVQHQLQFSEDLGRHIIDAHRSAYANLEETLLHQALARFMQLRSLDLYKPPSVAELLDWLQVLSLARGSYSEPLPNKVAQLPYLGVLLKEAEDVALCQTGTPDGRFGA